MRDTFKPYRDVADDLLARYKASVGEWAIALRIARAVRSRQRADNAIARAESLIDWIMASQPEHGGGGA